MDPCGTGSNFLVSLLNQLPGVVCHGEVFNPNFVGLHPTYARRFRIPRKATGKRDQHSESLCERLLAATPQNTLIGLEMVSHLHEALGHGLLRTSHYILRRGNAVLQAKVLADRPCDLLSAERPSELALVARAGIKSPPLCSRVAHVQEALETLAKHKVPCAQSVSLG